MKASVKYILSIGLYAALFYLFGSYTNCYREQWQTFYYDWHYIVETYCHVGSITRLMGDFLVQFFVSPHLANGLMALILAVIATVDARNINKLSGGNGIVMPLALLAPAYLGLLAFDNYWNLGGVMAYLLMSIVTSIHVSIENRKARLAWAVGGAFVLYILGGGIAMLYAIVVMIIEKKEDKQYFLFALPVAMVAMAAYCSLRCGALGSWSVALTPEAYYNPREESPILVWLPWVCNAVAVLASTMVVKFNSVLTFSAKTDRIVLGVMLVGIVGIVYGSYKCTIVKGDELFKEFSTMSCNKDWDGIIKKCGGRPSRNIYVQNVINEAWAEKQQLGEHLLDNPNTDITSLLMGNISTPYIAAQLSDIYYSMGHVSLAQFYAFESNEHIGQMSPRMLIRLAETSMIYGENALAKKYLNYLCHTLYYRGWAEKQLQMIECGTLSRELCAKRGCILKDNQLRGGYVILEDLLEIARNNPMHGTTAQYLVATSIFIGNESDYKPMVNELMELNALPIPLSSHFQRIYNMIKQ